MMISQNNFTKLGYMVSLKGYFSNGTTFDAVVATFISSSVKFYLIPPDAKLPLTRSTFTTVLDKESWKLVRFSLSEIEMKTLDDKYVIFPCQYQNKKVLWVSILNQKIPENVTKVAAELFKNIETASQKTVERCYLLWNEPKHVTVEISEQKPAINRPGSQLEIKQDIVKSNLHPENDQKPLPNNPSCVKHHCKEKESPMFSLQSIVVPRSFTPHCKSLGNKKGILVTKQGENKVCNTKEKRVRFFISESYKSYKLWREARGGIPLLKTCNYGKRQVNNRASYLPNMTSKKQNNKSFVRVDRFLPNLTSTKKSVNTNKNLTSNMKFLYKKGCTKPIDFRKNHAFREDGHNLKVNSGRDKISGLEKIRTNKQLISPCTKEKKIMRKSIPISNDSPRKRHLTTWSIHEGPAKAIWPSLENNRSSERVSYVNNRSSERVSYANNQSGDSMCFNKEDTNLTTRLTPIHPRFKFLKHQNKINHLTSTKEINAYKHTVQRTVADKLPQQRKRIKSSKNARIISEENCFDNRKFPKTLSKNTQISKINEDKKQRKNTTKEKFNPQLIIQDCLSKCCQVTKPSTGVAALTEVKPIGTKESLFPYWSQASKNVEQLSYGAREIIKRGERSGSLNSTTLRNDLTQLLDFVRLSEERKKRKWLKLLVRKKRLCDILKSKQEYKIDLNEWLKNMVAGESAVATKKGEPIDNEKSSLEETYNSVNSKLILESEKLEKNYQLQFEERMCVEKRRIYQEMWKRVQECRVCRHIGLLLVCGDCLSASYCSKKCQIQDWMNGHEDTCNSKQDRTFAT
ncbi:uncharacterized protein LOC130622939 [Hydractinia symbiolongicarpus]|uniref:uncharacterized protein LOC130622939 n=1 Tax=Hydractinia symbiolongicarpus TaxID=13093 RepID=UPI00254E894D|nr:uncharacterized protein LOC130622939 [Hydractinia symbiolongicarpus]